MEPRADCAPSFNETDVERLLNAAWWDWPPAAITAHARTIVAGAPEELEQIAHGMGRLSS